MIEIDNTQDIVDSRDIIKRIEELESLRDDWQTDYELPAYIPDGSIEWTDDQTAKWDEWDNSDEGQELKALLHVQEQSEDCGDWVYGEALIRDDYFAKYTEDLARDCGFITGKVERWPYTCIDWEKAADELKQDYTCIDWDGVDYWMRS